MHRYKELDSKSPDWIAQMQLHRPTTTAVLPSNDVAAELPAPILVAQSQISDAHAEDQGNNINAAGSQTKLSTIIQEFAVLAQGPLTCIDSSAFYSASTHKVHIDPSVDSTDFYCTPHPHACLPCCMHRKEL